MKEKKVYLVRENNKELIIYICQIKGNHILNILCLKCDLKHKNYKIHILNV